MAPKGRPGPERPCFRPETEKGLQGPERDPSWDPSWAPPGPEGLRPPLFCNRKGRDP